MMDNWEAYWKKVNADGVIEKVFWNSPPEGAAMEDLRRFRNHMSPTLPLLDLGCGNGRQTRFLARHFARVIGVDISQSAIDLARSETVDEGNIEYTVFDATKTENAKGLHDELGDVNIYMRGVLHMVKIHDRPKFVDSLATLLGATGTLYQIELPLKAYFYLRTLSREALSMVPKIVRRVGFDLEDRARYFPNDTWIVIDQGDGVTIKSALETGDREIAVPANYLILRTKLSMESQRGDRSSPLVKLGICD